MLSIGSPAPSFSLPDQDGKPVTLGDLAGQWVVLYFYPRDDTPGCTIEACEFTSALPNFGKMNAQVFGCSADPAKAHLKFIAKYKLGIRLLTDADKKVMLAYGAWGKKVMYGKEVEGVIRSTVVIDPKGNVAAHWPKVSAAGHAAEVAHRLAVLRGDAAPTPAPVAQPQAEPSKPKAKPAKKPAKKPAAKSAPTKKPASKKPVAKHAAKKPAAKPVKKAAKKPAPARKKAGR